jgi:FAD/FMN-containing dehydrogenase
MISPSVIDSFKASVRGEILRPGEQRYDEARKIHNAMIDRHPAIIVRCAGVTDIIATVKLAREHKIAAPVLGTGHHVAGVSLCDGGIVIDLRAMKGIHVNPDLRTARVEPGVTWGELNHELQTFGLAATGGYVGTTGVGGLTLGGGLGWMVRKYGCALDNLISTDVVTADGRFLTASLKQNADLFWGLRGGRRKFRHRYIF